MGQNMADFLLRCFDQMESKPHFFGPFDFLCVFAAFPPHYFLLPSLWLLGTFVLRPVISQYIYISLRQCLQIVFFFFFYFLKSRWYFVSWLRCLSSAVCLLAMFVGRASPSGASISPLVATAKGGKFSVEELYGFNKKPKVTKGDSRKAENGHGKKEMKSKEIKERKESILAAQILEAARKLMERRRLEIYLRECDVMMEHNNMPYRWAEKQLNEAQTAPNISDGLNRDTNAHIFYCCSS